MNKILTLLLAFTLPIQVCLSEENAETSLKLPSEKWLAFSAAAQNLEFLRLRQSEGYDPSVLNERKKILAKSIAELVKLEELKALKITVKVETAKSRKDWFAALTKSIPMTDLSEKYGAFSLKYMLGIEELANVINFNPSEKHGINLYLPPLLVQRVEAALKSDGLIIADSSR